MKFVHYSDKPHVRRNDPKNAQRRIDRKGISAALASALFLGVVPIFGKVAILSGFTPFAVIAIRSGIATLLMLVVMVIWKRQFFYIYPVGLGGCLLAGIINGLGSILYYSALSRLGAGIGHLLYSFYPLFVAFWLVIDRQPITKLTGFGLILSVPAVFLLVQTNQGVNRSGRHGNDAWLRCPLCLSPSNQSTHSL